MATRYREVVEVKGYGLAPEDVREIVAEVSAELYGGNVVLRDIADASNTAGPRTTFTLRVSSSYGPGHRHSGSWSNPDRHYPAACWHAHRDVLAGLFARYPGARITTAVADYRGADGFAETFPGTGDRNVGAPIAPVSFRAVCHCEDAGSWTLEHGPASPARKRYPGGWNEPDGNRGVVFATLELRDGELRETGVRTVSYAAIGRCPFLILAGDHYRDDGRCRCDDPAERERMMRDWDYTLEDFRRAGIEV